MKHFLRRLFGMDLTDPVVGQIWRSRRTGSLIRVGQIRYTSDGEPIIAVEYQWGGPDSKRWTLPVHYAVGLFNWRCMLREDDRELVQAAPATPKPVVLRQGGNVNPPPMYARPQAPPRPSPPAPAPVATIHVDGSYVHVEWHIPPPNRCRMPVFAHREALHIATRGSAS